MAGAAGRRGSTCHHEARRQRHENHLPIRRRKHSRNNKTDGGKRRQGAAMSNYKNLEQQQQAVEAAKVTNAERLTCTHVFQKWPTLVVYEANEKRILDLINRWTGNNPDVLPSIQIFEEAIAENPAEFNTLAKQTEDVSRRQITDSIIELLATKGQAHYPFTR